MYGARAFGKVPASLPVGLYLAQGGVYGLKVKINVGARQAIAYRNAAE